MSDGTHDEVVAVDSVKIAASGEFELDEELIIFLELETSS
jgi:hypothetical protein